MTEGLYDVIRLRDQVLRTSRKGKRRVVAIAGAPASGKSTLAEALVAELAAADCPSQLVPMDGFHLHNSILEERGLRHRKGAPETFDSGGLLRLVAQLGSEPSLYYPVFNRRRDIAIAGAGYIDPGCDTIVIEGNYLLMDAPIWRDLAAFWDLSVMLTCPTEILEARLVQRWLDHGLSEDQAQARAESNDLPNARLVNNTSARADVEIRL